jgi:hypothetical protein
VAAEVRSAQGAPPLQYGQEVPRAWAQAQVAAGNFDADDFPDLQHQEPTDYVSYLRSVNGDDSRKQNAVVNPREPYSQLSDWNNKMGSGFELGTMYTVIAGLLNILAIYDAWGGPVMHHGRHPPKDDDKK